MFLLEIYLGKCIHSTNVNVTESININSMSRIHKYFYPEFDEQNFPITDFLFSKISTSQLKKEI